MRGHMPKEMELRCRCGEVVGRVENASPQKVNRVVCYCDDCQAFAHQLCRAITKVLGWRLRGRAWPNPFFQPKTREPAYPIAVLAEAQRETLRSLCGPKPAAL